MENTRGSHSSLSDHSQDAQQYNFTHRNQRMSLKCKICSSLVYFFFSFFSKDFQCAETTYNNNWEKRVSGKLLA